LKKIYLKDIAKDLNVSKTTVSLVLNNRGNENKISLETQKKVFDYVKKHDYKPNHFARGLSRGKSETIGLIIPNISDVFYARIAGCIEKKAKEFGFTVVFSSSNEDPEIERELISSMLNRQVDGLILASTQQNSLEIERLKNAEFPFVLIDRHYPNIDTNFVVVDNYGGVKKATKHLLKLERKKIAFISLKSELGAMRQRLLGFQDALLDFNIELNRDHIKELSFENYQNEMLQAIKELVQDPDKVDAIVFATHYLTSSGLRQLRCIHIDVPREIAIVSFDELSAFDLIDPAITAIIQPVEEIGNFAVEILLNEIEGRNGKVRIEKVLETELLIRKSCGSQ